MDGSSDHESAIEDDSAEEFISTFDMTPDQLHAAIGQFHQDDTVGEDHMSQVPFREEDGLASKEDKEAEYFQNFEADPVKAVQLL